MQILARMCTRTHARTKVHGAQHHCNLAHPRTNKERIFLKFAMTPVASRATPFPPATPGHVTTRASADWE
eukprot:1856572-Pyramimonas_sp.AAC.1